MGLLASAVFTAPAWPDNPSGSIPSIQATVSALRFFDGDSYPVPRQQRRYDDRFLHNSRFIHWELNLAHPAAGRPTAFEIEEVWSGPRGIGYRQKRVFRLQPTWVTSYWSGSANLPVSKTVQVPSPGDWGMRCRGVTGEWGPCAPGSEVQIAYWPRGAYRVDLFADRRLVASGQFLMLDKDAFQREMRAKVTDASRPTREIPPLRGRVRSLRFFDGGVSAAGGGERRYATQFAREQARVISWELDVQHAVAGRWTPVTFEALWYRAEGGRDRFLFRRVLQTAVAADWKRTRFDDDAESPLPAGAYRVDLWVERNKVASESFEIR